MAQSVDDIRATLTASDPTDSFFKVCVCAFVRAYARRCIEKLQRASVKSGTAQGENDAMIFFLRFSGRAKFKSLERVLQKIDCHTTATPISSQQLLFNPYKPDDDEAL